MTKLLATTAALATLAMPALAQPSGLWDHNGSAMRLVYNGGGSFAVIYESVRPGLAMTTPPGSPRFEGRRHGNRIIGNAFVHTKYCPGRSFPYRVAGSVYNESVIELYGPAAVVDPTTCRIVGYRPDSDNARVVFRLVQPDGPPPLPPIVVPAPMPIPVPVPVPVPTVPSNNNNNNNIVVPSGPVINNNITIRPTAPKELSPDEQAEALKRQGREFCWKYPAHEVCQSGPNERNGRPPAEAVPLDK